MVPSIGDGFSRPRLDASGLSGRFSSPKLEPPDPTNVIYKSNNSSKIKLRFEEIRQDLDHIWWDTVRFEEIQADFSKISTILGEIRWHSRRSKLISGEIQGDPSLFRRFSEQMYWVFEDSGDVCRIRWLFEPTEHYLNPKSTRPIDVGGRFWVPPPST